MDYLTTKRDSNGLKMTLHLRNESSPEDLGNTLRCKDLGKFLRFTRKQSGYKSQQSLLNVIEECTGLRINIQTWSRIEQGGQMLKADQLIAFCMTCGGIDGWLCCLEEIVLLTLPEPWRKKHEEEFKKEELQLALRRFKNSLSALEEQINKGDQMPKPASNGSSE